MTVRRFYPEYWQTSTTATVHHVTHPDRDAWCGQRWTDTSFIGVTTGHRRCARCRLLGEGV
jgi:hypothetical protein